MSDQGMIVVQFGDGLALGLHMQSGEPVHIDVLVRDPDGGSFGINITQIVDVLGIRAQIKELAEEAIERGKLTELKYPSGLVQNIMRH